MARLSQQTALVVRGEMSLADMKKQASDLKKKYGHLAQEDANAALGAGEGVPTISSDNLAWQIRGGEQIGFMREDRGVGQTLPMIVLAHAFANSLMPGRYVRGEQTTIECSAVAETLEGLAPPANWPADKRGAESCQLCPNNAFGSGDGGQGKACRNTDLLIVMPLHSFEPSTFNAKAVEKAPLYRMFIAPTSMRNWGKYAATVIDEKKGAGLPLHAIVTVATVQPSDKHKQEVTFAAASLVPPNVMDALTERRKEARELALKPPVYQAPKEGAKRTQGGGGKRVAPGTAKKKATKKR
jgi:hypothetical protein